EGQRPLADRASDVLRGLNAQGLQVEIPEYQIVPFGPGRSDFRTLTAPLAGDPSGTRIFEALRTVIPDMVYNDLSQRYENAPFVKPGAYEVWLGPEGR
ncbi:MAG: hypothetical protein LJE70_11340, partial [Chromatiaceae bacterium]|nr:hypothetical protein [Chromatiaceae bacterium]